MHPFQASSAIPHGLLLLRLLERRDDLDQAGNAAARERLAAATIAEAWPARVLGRIRHCLALTAPFRCPSVDA
jgi:hypothetical protein